ncbi:hypothetical protein Q4574_08690 [Aliiglaciecola sp. 3_MG-2023]|uniref:hypothetical protein n=1 Tax=Aliiglaciecola sp. 3_MG-2023 TaxID=3062644 RepID=UPI0026E4105C|nr:hypothetical protein [Aliiglaciecola sp. 3_MG-2023]MDO6693360.1 hypothetical protein [Aliiglaciecola sp. 3_MG-2023]
MSKNLILIAVVIVAAIIALTQLNHFKLDLDSTTDTTQGQSEKQPSSIKQYSYNDILNNDEFKQSMQQAVENNDLELAKSLQKRAIEIAEAANLPDTEMSLISGDNGLRFMQFLASRQLFVDKFQKYYLSFKDIQQLKRDYPEAQDLFERSDQLIDKRDKQIQALAEQLAQESGEEVEMYVQLAKEQWQERQSKIP